MTARGLALAVAVLATGCVPNPRNEIAAVAEAAMREAVREAPGKPLCVDRVIAPWQPAREARRIDPPSPPGFADLLKTGVFRGGGGIKGDAIGGVAIRGGAGCYDLRGPVIAGDRAMIEVHIPGVGWNVWLRRTQADWRVVMTTTSVYPG